MAPNKFASRSNTLVNVNDLAGKRTRYFSARRLDSNIAGPSSSRRSLGTSAAKRQRTTRNPLETPLYLVARTTTQSTSRALHKSQLRLHRSSLCVATSDIDETLVPLSFTVKENLWIKLPQVEEIHLVEDSDEEPLITVMHATKSSRKQLQNNLKDNFILLRLL